MVWVSLKTVSAKGTIQGCEVENPLSSPDEYMPETDKGMMVWSD